MMECGPVDRAYVPPARVAHDPALFIDRSLKGTVGGKVVLVTGGSSGIGLSAACRFAEAGAITVICARDGDKLADAVKDGVRRARRWRRCPR